jgi:hypothetical protein
MNLKYFSKYINFERGLTVDYLKSVWRKIAVVLHPDKGGNEETFKQAQNEYESLLQYVKAGFTAVSDSPEAYGSFNEFLAGIAPHVAECFKAVYNIPGIKDIEICGRWIWVHLNYNQVNERTALKMINVNGIPFKYSKTKIMWYWAGATSHALRNYSMEEIRNLYGSKSYPKQEQPEAQPETIEA